jgi:hypothetical protein
MAYLGIKLGDIVGVVTPDEDPGRPWARMPLRDAIERWRSEGRSKKLPPVRDVLWLRYDEAALVTYKGRGRGLPLLFLFARSPGTGAFYVYEKWILQDLVVP